MSWNSPEFVLGIVAIWTIGWLINNWIRTRHGFAPTDDFGQVASKDEIEATRKVALLMTENERLNGQRSRLEERIAVLERIATDPAERTARAIDALR